MTTEAVIETDIAELTFKISELCGGQGVGVVIGACFSIVMTALEIIDDKNMLKHASSSLYAMAEHLDMMVKAEPEVRH